VNTKSQAMIKLVVIIVLIHYDNNDRSDKAIQGDTNNNQLEIIDEFERLVTTATNTTISSQAVVVAAFYDNIINKTSSINDKIINNAPSSSSAITVVPSGTSLSRGKIIAVFSTLTDRMKRRLFG
jgi:hypothetical protein